MIGYLLQQALDNVLADLDVPRRVAALITQVVVDPGDPAFTNPSKPVGRSYREDEAKALAGGRGYKLMAEAKRGWRRVVPSPMPLEIVETDLIRRLVQAGAVVIAAGGGGVPVIKTPRGLQGVEAVIDKDLAAACLACAVKAQALLILTDVPKVCLNFNRPDQIELDVLRLEEARRHLRSGQFAAGSMGPKVLAATKFLEAGGEYAVIGALAEAEEVWARRAGTTILPDD